MYEILYTNYKLYFNSKFSLNIFTNPKNLVVLCALGFLSLSLYVSLAQTLHFDIPLYVSLIQTLHFDNEQFYILECRLQ